MDCGLLESARLAGVKVDITVKRQDINPRCQGIRDKGSRKGTRCNKLLVGKLTRPWELKCPRCGFVNNG
jgi:hypothetical protein